MPETPPQSGPPEVSIIIPARNEEENLGSCLQSLVAQPGVSFEIIVVNDHSTDRTKEIAESFPGVRVFEAGTLPDGWTGKNNAVTIGARAAQGTWLLFTDADTVHLPGSLTRALREADDHHADLLSYSPEQIAATFWEMAVLPVVFAELARQYPPKKVSDPNSPEAAANGQYLLIKRDVYATIGGHAAVANDVLEDVALARAVKAARKNIRFRYSPDAVRTRMYRNFRQLREGWTKNLALLFPDPGRLATIIVLMWLLPWLILAIWISGVFASPYWGTVFVGSFLYLASRINRANFTADMTLLGAVFGMPMFAYLLLCSRRAHARGNVSWKGRTYQAKDQCSTKAPQGTTISKGKLA